MPPTNDPGSRDMARDKIQGTSIFQTWLSFREEKYGESRADVIRWVNSVTGKKYINSRFVNYLQRERSLTDDIGALINNDLEDLLVWLIEEKGRSPKQLAEDLTLPIKEA